MIDYILHTYKGRPLEQKQGEEEGKAYLRASGASRQMIGAQSFFVLLRTDVCILLHQGERWLTICTRYENKHTENLWRSR